MVSEIIQCPDCNGAGYIRVTEIIGYVSHDMAMDACDMSMEGEAEYGPVDYPCAKCQSRGTLSKITKRSKRSEEQDECSGDQFS